MGNVLLDYDTSRVIKKYTSDAHYQELIYRYLFRSSEWFQLDAGFISEAQAIDSICKGIGDDYLKEGIVYCLNHWQDYNLVSGYGMEKLVHYLVDHGYHVYVLSNAHKRLENYIESLFPYHHLLDGIVFSAQIQLLKPQQEIYTYFMNRFNLAADECFFIDDLKRNCDAASKAGWHTYCYQHDFEQLCLTLGIDSLQ